MVPQLTKITSVDMYYYTFKADWQSSKDLILSLIDPFTTTDNFAILYNGDTEVNDVYIATEDRRMILALEDSFEQTELDDIDYIRDFMETSNRQWGVIGNNHLVNF